MRSILLVLTCLVLSFTVHSAEEAPDVSYRFVPFDINAALELPRYQKYQQFYATLSEGDKKAIAAVEASYQAEIAQVKAKGPSRETSLELRRLKRMQFEEILRVISPEAVSALMRVRQAD